MKKLQAFLDQFAQNTVQESLEDNTTENKRNFLIQLAQLLEPFYRRKEEVLYDEIDIETFCKFMHELHEDAEYMTNWREQLADILQNALSWREKSKQDTQNMYFLWDILKALKTENGAKWLKDDVLSELTERLLAQNITPHLLILPPHTDNPYKAKSYITTFKDTIKQDKTNNLPIFVKIDYATNKQEIEAWIQIHREPLVMNKSNKHGLDGKGGHKSNKGDTVSLLFCKTVEDAQNLLDSAIGDKRLSEKKLYNYDETVGKFIIFFYEGDNPQNQYHAFHFETEQEAINKIPHNIMQELKDKYRLK